MLAPAFAVITRAKTFTEFPCWTSAEARVRVSAKIETSCPAGSMSCVSVTSTSVMTKLLAGGVVTNGRLATRVAVTGSFSPVTMLEHPAGERRADEQIAGRRHLVRARRASNLVRRQSTLPYACAVHEPLAAGSRRAPHEWSAPAETDLPSAVERLFGDGRPVLVDDCAPVADRDGDVVPVAVLDADVLAGEDVLARRASRAALAPEKDEPSFLQPDRAAADVLSFTAFPVEEKAERLRVEF